MVIPYSWKQPGDLRGQFINVGCMLPWMDYTPRTVDEIIAGNHNLYHPTIGKHFHSGLAVDQHRISCHWLKSQPVSNSFFRCFGKHHFPYLAHNSKGFIP